MSGLAVGLAALIVMVVLLGLRVPIGVAMMTVGLAGYAAVVGWEPAVGTLRSLAYDTFASYTFSVVPLFLLMGEFATRAGLSGSLFEAANAWVGHRRGGLAMATIGASAGFGAITGSSLATAATMGRVALPEMRRRGYSGALATGSVAAGGTLGILVPPSIVLVIYAILAEQNVAELFAAALLPAALAIVGYLLAIAVYVRLRPTEAQPAARSDARTRRRALVRVWPVLAIFAVVIGGIYAGLFTPTEAAAVGVVATGVLAAARGSLTVRGFSDALLAVSGTSGMIFLIVLGAELLNVLLAVTRLPQTVAERIAAADVAGIAIVLAVLALYLLLGTVMDSLSVILLTTPIFFPVIAGLDLGLPPDEVGIWFGILTLVTVEVGLITPPVGLNVFVINALAKDVPMAATFRGVVPFLVSDLVRIGLLVAVPALSLVATRAWF